MYVKKNIYNGIIHSSTLGQAENPKPTTSTAIGSEVPIPQINGQVNSNKSSHNRLELPVEKINIEELGINWNDFSEEFKISPVQCNASSRQFATAAGKGITISEAGMSTAMNVEFNITSEVPRSKGQSKVPPSPEFQSAASVAPKHFAEKAPVKLKFDLPEPAEKKEKLNPAKRMTKLSNQLKSVWI